MVTINEIYRVFDTPEKITTPIFEGYMEAIRLRLPVTLELVEEKNLEYRIELKHIVNEERLSMLDLKPLLDKGWGVDKTNDLLVLKI